MHTFRLGLNYWPARTAMGWWSAFDRVELDADFARIAASGFDSVRLFLTWEDFQPAPDRIDPAMIGRLVDTLEIAQTHGLAIMPTLFTGHMSGVNWLPPWALAPEDDPQAGGDLRFRVSSGGRVGRMSLRNWYTDPTVQQAQRSLASVLARAVAGHAALWAWDLGNENSNCVIPPSTDHARTWLSRMVDAIRAADDSALVTIGLHMEDLEQDRKLGPAEAADVCDFLTMHGYPGYASWSRGATDEQLLPFLARVTRWLGNGADVLFSEFGLPTYRSGDAAGEAANRAASTPLIEEAEAAAYIGRGLGALAASACTGAMLWCHTDYPPQLWNQPPLDAAVHERSFGLWRADGSRKPALDVIERFARAGVQSGAHHSANDSWIDIDRGDFYRDASTQLPRLYGRYCQVSSTSGRTW